MNFFEYKKRVDLEKKHTQFLPPGKNQSSPPPLALPSASQERALSRAEERQRRRMTSSSYSGSARQKRALRRKNGLDEWFYDPRLERYRQVPPLPSDNNDPNVPRRKGENVEDYRERTAKYRKLLEDWFPDEVIREVFRRHPIEILFNGKPLWILYPLTFFAFLVGLFVPAALFFFAAVLVITILATIWYVIDWYNDYVIVTSMRIIQLERTLFLNNEKTEIPLEKVQEIRYQKRTNVFEWLFSVGTIEVTSSGRTKLTFERVRNPVRIRQEWDVLKKSYFDARTNFRRDRLKNYIESRLFDVPLENWNAEFENIEVDAVENPNWFQRTFPTGAIKNGKEFTWHSHIFFLIRTILLVFVMAIVWAIFGVVVLPMIIGLNNGILSAVASVIYFLALFGLFFSVWYNYENWINDKYILGPDKLTDIVRSPFGFDETVGTIEIRNIQDISYDQGGLIANVLNYGDVIITTVGGSGTTIRRVPAPDDIKEEILRRKELIKFQDEERQDRLQADTFVNYYDIVHKYQQGHYDQPQ
jgi:hypothetical protein